MYRFENSHIFTTLILLNFSRHWVVWKNGTHSLVKHKALVVGRGAYFRTHRKEKSLSKGYFIDKNWTQTKAIFRLLCPKSLDKNLFFLLVDGSIDFFLLCVIPSVIQLSMFASSGSWLVLPASRVCLFFSFPDDVSGSEMVLVCFDSIAVIHTYVI